jgi:dihydrofolate synthase/folylpolyglutamate synthase
MTYQATLDYLFSRLPMFQRVGASAFKKDLTNTLALCGALDNPQNKFPTIHVGGTNGKGSTAHAIAAILQAAGYKTGLYISPHYRDFRERIKINGNYISEAEVIQFTEQNRHLFEQIEPSFFEMTVAMAFDHFAQHRVDVAVIEVGLGGRLDSTNVIMPRLSVITNISFDHTQFLGDTLPLIAAEKAGIIKPHIPVVIGETHPETAQVFRQKAAECHAAIYFADQNFELSQFESHLNSTKGNIHPLDASNQAAETIYINSDLSGNYQQKNLLTIWQAAQLLPQVGFERVNNAIIGLALQQVKTSTNFFGRWQVLQQQPLVIADSAHNIAGLQYAMQQLTQLPHRHLRLVIGMVADKDISGMLALLPTHAHYYFCKADIPRAMSAPHLSEQAATFGLHGAVYQSVKDALKNALAAAQPDDIIYVGGSTFVVAEAI